MVKFTSFIHRFVSTLDLIILLPRYALLPVLPQTRSAKGFDFCGNWVKR